MNELALANLHKTIGSIADSISDYVELPEAMKRRDKREPGRLRKMAYEEKIIRVLKKRWKKQKEKAIYLLNLQYPGRKDVKPGVINPDDFVDDITENELRIILLSAFKHGVELFEDSVLIGMDYTAVNTRAIEWARKYTYELVKQIDETTVKVLQNAVSSFANTPGMTIRDVIDLLPFDDVRGFRVATTEITRAYATANIESGKELQKEYPGVRVVKTWATNNDDRVCEICGPLDGMEVDIDSLFDEANGILEPPAHVNCILPGNEINPLGNILAMTKSFYNGRCIEITIANGRRITITENHPVLTDRGWVLAKLINKFDNVISTSRINYPIFDPYYYQRPARIEEIFSSLEKSGLMGSATMPLSPEDFYGDGKFINGNIKIINANGFLGSYGDSILRKQVNKNALINGFTTTGSFMGQSTQNFFRVRNNPAFSSDMGISQHGRAFGISSIMPANKHGIGNIPWLQSGFKNALSESPAINTNLARKFLLRFSGNITSEKVIKVKNFNFSGHVYNLQSDPYNLFSVNGIITHNCRCWIMVRTRING